jgi:hypothetical protein
MLLTSVNCAATFAELHLDDEGGCTSGLHLPPVTCRQDLQLKLGEARSDSEATRKQLDDKAAEAHRLAAELEAAHVQVCASAVSVVCADVSSVRPHLLLQPRLGGMQGF